jgi:hypothetical protein
MFPRNDGCAKIAKLVLKSFPECWENVIKINLGNIDDSVDISECVWVGKVTKK